MMKLIAAWLLALMAEATFYFQLTDGYVNTETNIYVYWKPSSSSAYTESYVIITIPSRLGFSYALATPTTCVDSGFIAGSFISDTPVCEFSDNSDGDVELKISNFETSSNPSKYEVVVSGLITSNAEVWNWVDNDSGTGIYGESYDSADTFLELQNTSNNFNVQYITLTSGVTLTGDPSQNNVAGTLTVDFEMTNTLPVDGTFTLHLPYQNSPYLGLIVQPDIPMIVDQDTLVIQASTISPSTTFPTASFAYTEETQFVILKISLGNSAEVAAGATFHLELSEILMPPSLAPLAGFEMWTGDVDFNKIEFADYPTLTNSLPGTQTTASFLSTVNMLGKTGVGEADQKYRFTAYLAGDLPMDSYFTLQVPTAVGLPSNPETNLAFVCISGCDEEEMTVTYEEPQRLLKFTGVVPDENSALYQPGPLSFELDGFTNPQSSDSAEFILTTYATFLSGEYMIDQLSGMTINADQGECIFSSFVPTDDNYMIYGVAESWTATLACEHDLVVSESPTLRLTLPQDFYVINTSACVVTLLDPSFRCSGYNETNTIEITQFLTSDISKNTEFSFTVDSIRNPTQIKQAYEITVEILSDSGGVIDIGTTFVWDYLMTIGTITHFSVTPDDYTVGAAPTFYKFSIQPSGEFLEKSYLEITLPEEIELYQESELELKCSYDLSGFTYSRLSCRVYGGNRIRVDGGFAYEASSNMLVNQAMVPPTVEFKLPQFRNPRIMEATGPFGVTIYDDGGDEMYTWNNTYAPTLNGVSSSAITEGPAVKMSISSSPSSVVISPESRQNGALTNYNISIEVSNYLVERDTLIFKLPDPFFFSESTEVKGLSMNLRDEQQYLVSINLDEIEITLKLPIYSGRRLQSGSLEVISPGETIKLGFTNIKNGISTEPSNGSVEYAAYSGGFLIESLSTGLTLQNTEPGQILPRFTTMLPDDFRQSVTTNYTLTFRPLNYQKGMEIKVWLPPEVEFGQNWIQCYGIEGTDKDKLSCSMNTQDRSVTITDAVEVTSGNPGSISLVFETLKNPAENIITSTFVIHTHTQSGYELDVLEADLKVNFFCEYPCKACLDTQPSYCVDCYTVGDFQLLHENECLAGCPSSFTLTPEKQSNCTKCDDVCATCDMFPSQCTSCREGYRLQDNTCFETVIYPFPWLALALIQLCLVVCSEICTRTESRAKETFIAFLWFPELGAWATFMYFHAVRLGYWGSFLIAGIAVLIYALLNCSHMCVHRRKIKPKSLHSYKAIQTNFRCVTAVVIWASYCFSFRFSLMLVSYFCVCPCFRGDYSNLNWLHHNRISLAFLVLCYPLMMCSTGYFLYTDGLYSYTGFAAIEVIVLSSLMAMTTLLDSITGMRRTASHEEPTKRGRRVKPQDVMGDYESSDDEGGKKRSKAKKDQLEAVVEYGDDGSRLDFDPDKSRSSDRPLISLSQFKDVDLDEDTKQQIAQLEEMARQMREEKELLRKDKEMLLLQRQNKKKQVSHQQIIVEDTQNNETTQNTSQQQMIIVQDDQPSAQQSSSHHQPIPVPQPRISPPKRQRQNEQIQSDYEDNDHHPQDISLEHQEQTIRRPYRDVEGLEMVSNQSPILQSKSKVPDQLPDYEQAAESDSAPDEGILMQAQLPIPTFGLVGPNDNNDSGDEDAENPRFGGFGAYYREMDDGLGERALRQISPRQGGDSLVGHDSLHDEGHVRLESAQSPRVSEAENHQSVFESQNEIFPSNASGQQVTNANRQIGTSEVYQNRSDAQLENASSREGIKTAEQHLYEKDNANFGLDDARQPLTANEVNPIRPALTVEQVDNHSSQHQSTRQFLERESASRGQTNPARSQYEGEPEFVIRNDAVDAYGTHEGAIQRQATPQNYFVDEPHSQGKASQFSRADQTDHEYMSRTEAVLSKDQNVVHVEGEHYAGVEHQAVATAGVASNAERQLDGSEQLNIERELPQFSRDKSQINKSDYENQILPGTATYSEDPNQRLANDLQNFVLPASAHYDKVGIQVIEGPQDRFIGTGAVASEADPVQSAQEQQQFIAHQNALYSQASAAHEAQTADQLNIEQKTTPQFSVLGSQRKSTQHEYINQEQAQYSRLPDDRKNLEGPYEISILNEALKSQGTQERHAETTEILEQKTNPQYSHLGSQRRSTQHEYIENQPAQYSRVNQDPQIVTGPQDMQLNNEAINSQASDINKVAETEHLNIEHGTNPQYSVFESQQRTEQQEYFERESAQYSRLPQEKKERADQKIVLNDPLQLVDDSGASESSEGILDHNPFTSIEKKFKIRTKEGHTQDAATFLQNELHRHLQPQAQPDQRHIMYSDKSESSVEEGMDITPSQFNQANGRFDGKSQGLKGLSLLAQSNVVPGSSNKAAVSASLPMSPSQFVQGIQQSDQQKSLKPIDEESLLSDPILNSKSKRKAIKTNKTFAESQEVQMGGNLAAHLNQGTNSHTQLNPLHAAGVPKQTNNYV